MLSLSSLTHLSAIVCCRIAHPTAAIVLSLSAGLLGNFGVSQQRQHQSTWRVLDRLLSSISTLNHHGRLSIVEGSLYMQSTDHDFDVVRFAAMDSITAIAIRAMGTLANGLTIREIFEYLLNLGFKSNSGENSDPRQPKSGRYRLSPLPA